ncbi:MAG: hypothetical protein AAGI30_12105 [Planctomycetota bacterium]
MTASSRAVLRTAGFLLGAVLLALAALFAVRHIDLGTLASAVRTPGGIGKLGTLAALTALGPVLAAATFHYLLRAHAGVPFGEMVALITSSWLANFAPLWPGLAGRVAYHRLVHGLAVKRSMMALVWARVLTATVAAIGLSTWVLGPWAGACAAPVALGIALGARLTGDRAADLLAAGACRALELMVWAARYAIALELLSLASSIELVLSLAAVSMLVQAVPLAPNGLGMREWASGWVGARSGLALADGLSADLVNRAVDVVVAVPLGLVAFTMLARRRLTNPQEPAPGSARDD